MPRVLLLAGPESLLVDEVASRLTAHVLGEGADHPGGAERQVLYADSVTPEDLVAAGGTPGLFAERRLVVVRGLGDAPARTLERLRAAVEGARASRGGWPTEGTTVVFVAVTDDAKAPGLRFLPDADRVDVRGPAKRAVPGWVRERARALGLDCTPPAAQLLVELTGEDLGRLARELEKAAAYLASEPEGRRLLTEEIVRAMAGEARTHQYYELTQALEDGNRPAALRVLEGLLGAGEPAPLILFWLAGYAHDLGRALGAMAEGADVRGVAAALRVPGRRPRPDFAVERFMARATTVGAAGAAAATRLCYETDRRLKTSAGSPRALLTVLVADLAR